MTAMFSANAQAVLKFLQANPDGDFTADMIATATGLSTASVNGTVTGLARANKGFAFREEVEGIEKKVIRLTEKGMAVDPEMEKPELSAE
jgi:hypothetical protein